jgi:hypothetical protein
MRSNIQVNGVIIMKKVCVLTAAGLLFTSLAAHAVDDTYVFESISTVQHSYDSQARTALTGVIAGTSTTLSVPANGDVTGSRCAKYYDVMLMEPGVYSLSVTIRTITFNGSGGIPETSVTLSKCSLTRIP